MPSPPQGPNDRRFNEAEPLTPSADAHATTVPAPSGPPPLLLTRRRAQANATAPWPTPPSSRGYAAESPESSTPFAAAVDVDAEGSGSPEALEPDADYRAAVGPWWRRLKAPSRQLRTGALIAVVAAGVGWTAGAKPWASGRTTSKIAAAKPALNQHARTPQATAHVNRRVAVNTKSKLPSVATPTQPKAVAKQTGTATPAAGAKQLAAPPSHVVAKPPASKSTSKAKAPVSKTLAAKPKTVAAQAAKSKAPAAK